MMSKYINATSVQLFIGTSVTHVSQVSLGERIPFTEDSHGNPQVDGEDVAAVTSIALKCYILQYLATILENIGGAGLSCDECHYCR